VTRYPIKLGETVHYVDGKALIPAIVIRLPQGERDGWVGEGETVDLITFDRSGSHVLENIALDPDGSEGTWSPSDVTVTQHT